MKKQSASSRIRARWQHCCQMLYDRGWSTRDVEVVCQALKNVTFFTWLSTTDIHFVESAIYRNVDNDAKKNCYKAILSTWRQDIQRAVMFVKDEYNNGNRDEVIRYFESLGGF